MLRNVVKQINKKMILARSLQTSSLKLQSSFPIEVHWQLPDGSMKSCWATPGEMMYDVAIDNSIDEDMSGMFGVCGGGMCCSTCHVILDQEVYREG